MSNSVVKILRNAAQVALGLALLSAPGIHAQSAPAKTKKSPAAPAQHNAIIFIADGLRHGSINSTDAPTLLALRQAGVHFVNSHGIFPTFTTANAATMATGHLLGDTGDFSNTIVPGFAIFNTGNFGQAPGTLTPFIENDRVLGDLDDHFSGNYLNEETILSLARKAGYNTASVGKVGPVAIFDVQQLQPSAKTFVTPNTVFIDDSTGGAAGIPLSSQIITALMNAGLPTTTPGRGANGSSGNNVTPGTLVANVTQQQYFANALTEAILPVFAQSSQPFVAVFWSRDPDGTQHNQGDSLNSLTPGINGPTSKAAVHNADNNLAQILAYLNANPAIAANTDVFVTADHGFSTISHHETDSSGKNFIGDYASTFTYKDATGRQEVNTGFTPVGFVAIDLAHEFGLSLYDPDNQILAADGVTKVYEPVDPTAAQQTASVRQHPGSGNGVIGGTGSIPPAGTSTDATILVAANGGSDLIYVPSHDQTTVQHIVAFLRGQAYTGGLFVDDAFGPIPGALPLSAIGLKGDTPLPNPSVVINFKNFALDPADPNQSRVEIADSGLQEGQGMHGSFSRADTYNNMVAVGPDFKKGYTDIAPVSNADITPTLAKALGLSPPSNGALQGRVLVEALAGGPTVKSSEVVVALNPSGPANEGRTVVVFQNYAGFRYYDAACFVSPAALDAADKGKNASNLCQ
jgi:arylsulfatase A-like enzyme